jgi:hypothetical protein
MSEEMRARTGPETFRFYAPHLLEWVTAGWPELGRRVLQSLHGLERWDLPIGWKDGAGAWIAAFHIKLESPNFFMRDFRIRSAARAKWTRQLIAMIGKVEGVASHRGLIELGRMPNCQIPMAVQFVRLVPSAREFIRDSDNLAFSVKSIRDAMTDVGLIKDDKFKWLHAAPVVQDVSPIGVPVTLFILRPADLPAATLGGSRVHQPAHQIAHRESGAQDGGTEEGRTVPGPRRRPRARAAHT